MAATGKSKTTVWRWQERFAEAGVEGLLCDKTRPPGKARISIGKTAEVVRLTPAPPPHEATHWTARAKAKAVEPGVATVQRIWAAHGLAPHRWRIFKLSKAPAFVEKLHDIVGLYVSPPAHAVVLSFDEKSQIQALDRTQPGLPMKKGRGATMAHAHKHAKVRAWLERHPRWSFHFTPTPEARRFSFGRRSAGGNQPLHRRTQRN